MRRIAFLLALLLAAAPARGEPLPIFDAHLHYNVEAFEGYPPGRVLELLRANGVRGALANSRPNDGSRRLLEAEAPDLWVVPFVRPYAARGDRRTWFRDPKTLTLIEAELARGGYRGIGEFHIDRREDAGHDVLKRIVTLAAERGLWLLAHVDEVVVETLFAHDPRAKVIWAHTGFSTPPEEVERLLARRPALMAELSYRGGLTDSSGQLTPEWRRLFTERADRFLLGSDTWVNERWDGYGATMAAYRAWLGQLPREAAERIAWRNAERLFGSP